jgi:hypothetical protein
MTIRWSLILITAVCSIILLAIATVWITSGPVISPHRLARLEVATQQDVLRELGQPAEIQSSRSWIYERWGNFGYVTISFDDQGRVRTINDESVFRW